MKTIISPVKVKGYKTIIIDLHRKTLTDLLNELPKIDCKKLTGYSIGGAMALILAQSLKLKELTLYSPTPYFKEEIKNFEPQFIKVLGKRRMADIENYSVNDFSKIKAMTTIIVGSNEEKGQIKFAKLLNEKIKKSSLVIKQGLSHSDLTQNNP